MPTQTMQTNGADNYHKEVVAADATSEAVEIADVPGSRCVSFFVAPSGTAKVQVTISSRDDVRNDNAVWQDWSLGDVTEDANDGTEFPITAARLVTTGGIASWEVRV